MHMHSHIATYLQRMICKDIEPGDNDDYYSRLPILILIFCTVELLHCAIARLWFWMIGAPLPFSVVYEVKRYFPESKKNRQL